MLPRPPPPPPPRSLVVDFNTTAGWNKTEEGFETSLMGG